MRLCVFQIGQLRAVHSNMNVNIPQLFRCGILQNQSDQSNVLLIMQKKKQA